MREINVFIDIKCDNKRICHLNSWGGLQLDLQHRQLMYIFVSKSTWDYHVEIKTTYNKQKNCKV